jgi:hypothetical protein
MADSSSKLIKALFSSSNSGENKTNFDASKINPRILKILGVNEFDIEDEQEYLSLLKEKMLLISMEKSKLPREDEEVIIEEFKRIKSKKFPKKKLTADSFKKNLSLGENFNLSFGEKISSVIGKSNFIDISKIIPKSFIETELDSGKTNEPEETEEVKNIKTTKVNNIEEVRNVISKLISGKTNEPEEVKNIKTTKVNNIEEVRNVISKLISGKTNEPEETEEVKNIKTTKVNNIEEVRNVISKLISGKTNEPEEVKNIEEELISEEIDERILRLLNLKDTFDIDYGTYISLLKEKLVLSSLGKQKIPREEEVLLQEEYKRVKSKKDKGRFKPKKKITAEIFATEPSVGNIKNNLLFGEPEKRQLALPPAVDKMSGKSDIQEIIDSLATIIEQLTLFNSLSRDEQERDRRATENRRRREREGELEKGFDGVMKAAEKVIAPVKSILDRIINFLVMTLIGRSLVLILRWFSDPENKEKVKAIGRFLGDHWPKLLALFIAFGTGLGGFVRGLIGVVIKGTGALIKGAFWLAKKAGIKGAAGAFKFLGGPKGKLIGKGLELAAVVGGTLALSKGLEDFGGIGGGETSPPSGLSAEEETTPRATFSGGGFANLKNLFGNIGGMFNGVVSGPKGTDKVPAMLTDGEFVMSRGAVQKYGVDTLEGMNAAGGGNNKPKVVEGTTYAAGGGLVGDNSRSRLRSAARSLTPDAAEGLRTQKFTTLWHGTSDIYKKMIESGGIDPKKFTFGALGEGFYTTPDIKIARLYAEQSAELGGGKPALVRLRVPTNVLNQYTANLRDKGRVLSGNELIQYTDNFRPQLRGNTRSSNMYVWGGRGQTTPEGFGPRIGNVGKGGLSMSQQYDAANLANRFGTTEASPSTIKSPKAPQRWMDKFISGGPKITEKTTRVVRSPIPATSAIVPYVGGGLARTGVSGGLTTPPIQRINTNMNVRGGIGGLRSTGIEILANYLMERGFDKINAMIIAKKIDEGKKLTGDKKENYVERLRNIVDREERWQRGFGGIFDSILGMGKESSSQKMSKSAKAILEGIGSGAHQGGAIKGGWGLRMQEFKDAPKTSIMTDDKGRPFVGHKAFRGGKLVYVRGPEPGTGTTNPLEMLGRMINPGAYKENDAKLAGQKHKEAMVNSLQSFQERGMSPNAQARMMKQMGGNLKDVQNNLDFRKKTQAKIAPTKPTSKSSAITPPQQNKVNVTYSERMKKRREIRNAGSRRGGTSSAAPQVPQFSSSSRTRSRKRTASTYGIG